MLSAALSLPDLDIAAFAQAALADEAIALALPCFPCGGDKRPLTSRGFKDASRDPVAVRRMFSAPATALIGVPTGPASGVVVVDVDTKNGRAGMAWLERHASALPDTRTHRTRSGGLHLLFRPPEGVEIANSQSRIAPGVDVRGQGGYIVVPPSPGYSVIVDAPPAEMPAWLAEECRRRPLPPPTPLVRRAPRDATEAGARRLLSLVEFVATAPEGERNGRLFWAACRAADTAMAGEMPPRSAALALEQAAHTAGLHRVEARRTILSAFRSACGSVAA